MAIVPEARDEAEVRRSGCGRPVKTRYPQPISAQTLAVRANCCLAFASIRASGRTSTTHPVPSPRCMNRSGT